MREHNRKSTFLVAAFLAVLIIPSVLSVESVAREPEAGEITTYDFRIGGEPGEDPHLKIKPEIQFEMDSGSYGSSISDPAGDKDYCHVQAVCMREGRGYFRGSRVNLVWRMIIQAWLWTAHR